MRSKPLLLTEATFEETIKASDRPLLVDFHADWCGPCHVLSPIVEEVAIEHADRLAVAKLDVDSCPDVTRRYGVMSIPTLILFQDGVEARRIVGALPKGALVAQLADVLDGAA